MKRKVAFLAKEYRHLEAFHIPFMKVLSSKGYEVHAYAAPDDSKGTIMAEGFVCHDMKFGRNPFKISYVIVLRDLVESFKQERFCLIHVNTPVAGVLGRIAGKMAGIRLVIYTAHGFHFYSGAPFVYWAIYYPVERLMARLTDYLITINEEDYLRAQKFHVRKEVLYVPGVGVDVEKFSRARSLQNREQVRTQLGICGGDFVVACVAELTQNKNQEQLIQAVEKLAGKFNTVRCLLVGTGDNETFLKKLVAQRRLGRYIQFLGFRHDVPEILAACDAVVLLSKREGLPKALMEGMACGKPIVASDVRGCRDLVINGETGLLVPLGDVDATANALLNLIGNPRRRTLMGERSFQRVATFSVLEIARRIGGIYDRHL